jgi:GNAT superfamily N-acetyltransferase
LLRDYHAPMVLPDGPRRPTLDSTPTELGLRIAAAGPWRHRHPVGQPHPGSAYAVVAGVPCAALPLPWAWAAQACLSAVPSEDLVEVTSEVVTWLTRNGHAGWQVEIGSEWAPLLVDSLGLTQVREHEVWVSTGEPPVASVEAGPPVDEDEFLAVFGPDLAPMIRGQLERPDWEVAVMREAGESIGCFRLMDLADTTYLGGVTVVPHRRGQGLGRALSAYATSRARRRSDLVWLHCEPELGPFYASLGYALQGRTTFLGPR